MNSIDLLPTFAEAAGVDRAAWRNVDGVSLMDLIREGEPLAPRPMYWHYPHYSNQLGRPAGAMRQGDWKLVELYEDNSLELYNLAKDPGEEHNLARMQPDRTREMHGMLRRWREAVGAKMPVPNPNYDPAREHYGYWWKLGTTRR